MHGNATKESHVLTTFISGAHVANSRSQFRKVERGAITKWGQTLSSNSDAMKAMLCMVLPEQEKLSH